MSTSDWQWCAEGLLGGAAIEVISSFDQRHLVCTNSSNSLLPRHSEQQGLLLTFKEKLKAKIYFCRITASTGAQVYDVLIQGKFLCTPRTKLI